MQIALIYRISSAMVWIRLLHAVPAVCFFRRGFRKNHNINWHNLVPGYLYMLAVHVGGGPPFSIVIDLESTAAHSYQTIAESSTAKYKGGYTRHRRIMPA